MDYEDDNLGCPRCGRDYEMPRRFVIRSEDMDYAVIPKMLNCLHSCCASCCEEMYERSGVEESIRCPTCRDTQIVNKNVRTLPLDGVAIQQIYASGGAEMMAYCARCHDESESYSWCFDCQTALCKFHHEDHNKTIDFFGHNIQTFEKIAEEHIPIDPHLPPIACPEELVADCSAYCKTCGYLISATAMVKKHLGHDIVSGKDLYEESSINIKTASDNVQDREEELSGAMNHLKGVLNQLDEESDTVISNIQAQFNSIKKMVEEREMSLLNRLEDIAQRKRNVLESQLNELGDVLENCRQSVNVAEAVCNQRDPPDADGLYVVGAANTIINRCRKVNEQALAMSLSPAADPVVGFTIDRREVKVIDTLLRSLGSLNTLEEDYHGDDDVDNNNMNNDQSDNNSSSNSYRPTDMLGNDADHVPILAGIHDKYMAETNLVGSPNRSPSRSPSFKNLPREIISNGLNGSSIKPSKLTLDGNESNINHLPVSLHFTVKTAPQSQLSAMSDRTKSMERLIIEARLNPADEDATAISNSIINGTGDISESKDNDSISSPNKTAKSLLNTQKMMVSLPSSKGQKGFDDVQEALGTIVGQIVIDTEVDRRYFPRHEVRNLLESVHGEVVPTFHIVKELAVL